MSLRANRRPDHHLATTPSHRLNSTEAIPYNGVVWSRMRFHMPSPCSAGFRIRVPCLVRYHHALFTHFQATHFYQGWRPQGHSGPILSPHGLPFSLCEPTMRLYGHTWSLLTLATSFPKIHRQPSSLATVHSSPYSRTHFPHLIHSLSTPPDFSSVMKLLIVLVLTCPSLRWGTCGFVSTRLGRYMRLHVDWSFNVRVQQSRRQ